MDQVTIGKFIAEQRRERKLTQEQLAEKLGVTQKSVSRWETGKNMPDLSLLQLLSAELGVTVSELLEGQKAKAAAKSADEAIGQLIDYSVSTRHQIFSKGEVDLISGVIAALVVALLLVAGIMNGQTVSLMILGLAGLGVAFRLVFGRCRGCGRLLPLLPRKTGACPFCGKKF